MTAKQALIERIEHHTEDHAAEWLARTEWEATGAENLTPDEVADAPGAKQEIAEGKSVDGEYLFRRPNL